jgi:hypothetical protein
MPTDTIHQPYIKSLDASDCLRLALKIKRQQPENLEQADFIAEQLVIAAQHHINQVVSELEAIK